MSNLDLIKFFSNPFNFNNQFNVKTNLEALHAITSVDGVNLAPFISSKLIYGLVQLFSNTQFPREGRDLALRILIHFTYQNTQFLLKQNIMTCVENLFPHDMHDSKLTTSYLTLFGNIADDDEEGKYFNFVAQSIRQFMKIEDSNYRLEVITWILSNYAKQRVDGDVILDILRGVLIQDYNDKALSNMVSILLNLSKQGYHRSIVCHSFFTKLFTLEYSSRDVEKFVNLLLQLTSIHQDDGVSQVIVEKCLLYDAIGCLECLETPKLRQFVENLLELAETDKISIIVYNPVVFRLLQENDPTNLPLLSTILGYATHFPKDRMVEFLKHSRFVVRHADYFNADSYDLLLDLLELNIETTLVKDLLSNKNVRSTADDDDVSLGDCCDDSSCCSDSE